MREIFSSRYNYSILNLEACSLIDHKKIKQTDYIYKYGVLNCKELSAPRTGPLAVHPDKIRKCQLQNDV